LGLLILVPAAEADTLADGKRAFASGEYRQAVQLLSGVSDPQAVCEASFYLGLSHYRLKQMDQAIVALGVAAACPESSADVSVALGEAYLEKGDHNRAAASFQRALDREPNSIPALRSLSSLFLHHEMNEQAIPMLERLTAVIPSDSQSRADLGAAYAGVMNLPKAREQFEMALRSNPDHAGALVGLANI
jgi:tetratricopeptide (TPR) repeat protein